MTGEDHSAIDVTLSGSDIFGVRPQPRSGATAAELAARYGTRGRRAADALPPDDIQARLEGLVWMVMSIRRSVRPSAEALAWFPADRVLNLIGEIERVSRTSVELAYHLCVHAPEMLLSIADADLHTFLLHVLEVYDRGGTQGCIRLMGQVSEYAKELRAERVGQSFSDVAVVLESFGRGLSGRRLKLVQGDEVYTDTETIHLPERLAQFGERRHNYQLYKAMIAHQWAQVWFGTWRLPVTEELRRFPDESRALRLFHALERLRLDARLARELPGLWREMSALGQLGGAEISEPHWGPSANALAARGVSVERTWEEVRLLYSSGWEIPTVCYQGELRPDRVAAVMARRAQREREAFRDQLAVIADELGGNLRAAPAEPLVFSVEPRPDTDWPGGLGFQLVLGDQPVPPMGDLEQLMHSIVQDFGQIPAEYLVPAGHGLYHQRRDPARDDGPPRAEPRDFVYDEWDCNRRSYRKGWCRLRERDVHPQDDDFVAGVRNRHRASLRHLYRTFEALRGEERLLRREPHGDDPDLDALVESHADWVLGNEMDHRLFQRRRRVERNVAVMFMVDMSGSTKGWINDVERESLVLLCESLELLGDRYAIYGFSGFTHMRCEIFRVKDFEEPYDDQVRARISGIRPQDYTRLGAVIRHLTAKLVAVEARTRVLVVLSDGRPDDEDGYRGEYGVEDTRQAVLESRSQGVHPFCITIDDQAREYLPRMFGATSYVQVEDTAKLPYRVSDIYRRITA